MLLFVFILNLCIRYEESENLQSDDDVSLSERIKHYIQREEDISQHQLWNKDGFWEDALMIGLKAQLDMMDPVLWDELDTEMLKEKVLGASSSSCLENQCSLALHNMIFGQLGTLAFTMHEMGLPKQEVPVSLSLSDASLALRSRS